MGFTGASGTALDAALADVPTTVSSLFRFDAASQQWRAFHRDAPAAINAFTVIDRLEAVFVRHTGNAPAMWKWNQIGPPAAP